MLSFRLTMPNIGSWNGKWTGESDLHYITRRVSKEKEEQLSGHNFYYNFGDGWGANIEVESVYANEAAKRRKKSTGFSGYDWMVDEIIEYGRILTLNERQNIKKQGE